MNFIHIISSYFRFIKSALLDNIELVTHYRLEEKGGRVPNLPYREDIIPCLK